MRECRTMIQHYFKIAFRNILKYKTQSIISILGLAVGFTCFALANLWIIIVFRSVEQPKTIRNIQA